MSCRRELWLREKKMPQTGRSENLSPPVTFLWYCIFAYQGCCRLPNLILSEPPAHRFPRFIFSSGSSDFV